MIVKDLISILKEMPQDAEVSHIWDGGPRTDINHVWASRNGEVMTADTDEVCYDEKWWPVDAKATPPSRYWNTPSTPQKLGDSK